MHPVARARSTQSFRTLGSQLVLSTTTLHPSASACLALRRHLSRLFNSSWLTRTYRLNLWLVRVAAGLGSISLLMSEPSPVLTHSSSLCEKVDLPLAGGPATSRISRGFEVGSSGGPLDGTLHGSNCSKKELSECTSGVLGYIGGRSSKNGKVR